MKQETKALMFDAHGTFFDTHSIASTCNETIRAAWLDFNPSVTWQTIGIYLAAQFDGAFQK